MQGRLDKQLRPGDNLWSSGTKAVLCCQRLPAIKTPAHLWSMLSVSVRRGGRSRAAAVSVHLPQMQSIKHVLMVSIAGTYV